MEEAVLTSRQDLEADENVASWRIMWRSEMTGVTGKGACLPLHRAEALLEIANMESYGITHWLEPVVSPSAQPAPSAAFAKAL